MAGERRLKVLHLVTWLRPGGIEKWLLEMLKEFDRTECAMDVCCKGPSLGTLSDIAKDEGAATFHCPMTPTHIGFGRRLSRILNEGGYDILHNHLGAYSGFPVWVAKRSGVRVITSYHNTHFSPQTLTRLPVLRTLRSVYSHFSVRYAVGSSDVITGCSNGVLTTVTGRETPGSMRRVLYYGAHLQPKQSHVERNAFRASLGYSADTPLVVHVGRFLEQKNHLGLLEIFGRVLREVPGAKLLMVGDGVLRSTVERAAQELRLTGNARFLGVRNDVARIMGNSDVFLFPSIHEGLPIAAMEASGAGLPVVGTNVAGLNEVVADGRTGVLHSLEDLDGMASSVARLLKDKEYASELGEAGRHRVGSDFSVARSAERLLSLYHECIGLS